MWVVTIYLIVMAVAQPISGKLADIYGYRRLYMWGLGLFFFASIASAFSFHVLWLIVFRALQALGGALIAPSGMAIVRNTVSKEKLSKVFGVFNLSMGLGASVGPLLGAFLISLWNWQAIFWVNVPFLFIAFTAGWFVIPRATPKKKMSLDFWGAFYLAVSFTFLILLVNPHSLWVYIVMGCTFIIFTFLFVQRERHTDSPIVDFSLFKNLPFTSANVSILCNNFIMYSVLLGMPLMLESTFHFTTQKIGLFISIFSVSSAVFGLIGGYLASKFGVRSTVTITFLISVISAILLIGLGWFHSYTYLGIALIMVGIGVGIGKPGMQTAALISVDKNSAGTASGVFSTFRYFGSMLSSSFISIISGSIKLFVILLVVSVIGLFISRGIKNPVIEKDKITA